MAINTYNPRLAQALGRSQGDLFVDYAAPVKAVLDKQEQEKLLQEEKEYKKAVIEANAYQKAMKEREAVAARLARQIQDYDPNKVHPKLLKEATYKMNAVKKTAREIINDPSLSEAERSIQLEEKVNREVKKIYQRSERLKDSDEDFLESGDILSKANSGFITNFNNIKHDPDGYDIIGDNAVINTNKFNQENKEDSNYKELIQKYGQGENIIVPLDEFEKIYPPIIQSWKKYKEVNGSIDGAAKSMATKGLTKSQFNSEIKNTIDGLRFTSDEIRSIAYDHLGKTEEAFAGYDANKDGEYSEDELNTWVKNQLTSAADSTYNNWFKPDLPDTGKKEILNEKISEQTMGSIINNPIKAIEQSGMPYKTEVRNNIITFYTPDQDGAKTINAQFDLKSKEGIKALAKFIVVYDYKEDKNLIYNINNYNITNEQMLEIQKSFLPNPKDLVDPFDPNN